MTAQRKLIEWDSGLRRQTHFSEDPAVVDAVNAMSLQQLSHFSRCKPTDLRDYLEQQLKWIEDSAYFLGIDLGRNPSQSEIAEKILLSNQTQRFRAYYAIKNPGKVVFLTET
jgi:hypothetical protein